MRGSQRIAKGITICCRWFSDVFYVPSQTGSHSVGDQYIGDIASAYVETSSFPESAKSSFRGIQIHKSVSNTR